MQIEGRRTLLVNFALSYRKTIDGKSFSFRQKEERKRERDEEEEEGEERIK